MQAIKLIKGRVIYVSPERLLLARGARLFESTDGGNNWGYLAALPVGLLHRTTLSIPLVCRLMRKGVHHLEIGDTQTLIIANRSSYILDKKEISFLQGLNGSRPLALCSVGDYFYYGEYCSNPKRFPVRVWRWRPGETAWSPAWVFNNVRHIHGIFHDPYTDAMWVTTGDEDSEAAIWRTDDKFATLHRVAGGSQQLRAVQLLFTTNHVYFGSDTPNEVNYIYRMDRQGNCVERLSKVGSSVFFGCKVGGCLFFSTAVEPSRMNYTRHSELWCSIDGVDWQKLTEFKKDIWPMKCFQYGQILFPSGPGDVRYLYFSPFSVSNHGLTFRIDVTAELIHGDQSRTQACEQRS